MLKAKVGDTVTFKNDDEFAHNVFSLSAMQSFDLGSYKKGESAQLKLTAPGTIEVECAIHPEMKMKIEVAQVNTTRRFLLAASPWRRCAVPRARGRRCARDAAAGRGQPAKPRLIRGRVVFRTLLRVVPWAGRQGRWPRGQAVHAASRRSHRQPVRTTCTRTMIIRRGGACRGPFGSHAALGRVSCPEEQIRDLVAFLRVLRQRPQP